MSSHSSKICGNFCFVFLFFCICLYSCFVFPGSVLTFLYKLRQFLGLALDFPSLIAHLSTRYRRVFLLFCFSSFHGTQQTSKQHVNSKRELMHIRKIVCSESDADSKEEIIGNTNFELRCHETCQPKFLAVPTSDSNIEKGNIISR